ncbi:hypothetical protein CLIB1423_19S02080 [[Candida] railenensis]|uniref:Uncharacterized protein n=1 Tax=[Candida] railenensis TaxID=45579 RepID=A0A9P0QTT3_9ASCO|nr:hypothetical protein CLIB1423_19S02080 [[Candida] railenensis]
MVRLIRHTNRGLFTIRQGLLERTSIGGVSRSSMMRLRMYSNRGMLDGIPGDEIKRQDVDESQVQMKGILQRSPIFLSSKYETGGSKNKVPDASVHCNEPTDVRLILNDGVSKVPVPGSVVEFDAGESNCNVGVVLEACSTKFNENYNKLTVLSLKNEILQVYTQDVTIHFHAVVDRKMIDEISVEILKYRRHEEESRVRLQMVGFIERFIDNSVALQKRLKAERQFDTVYSHYSQMHKITPISLLDVITSIKLSDTVALDISDTLFGHCTLVMACHLELANDPTKWIVPNLYKNNRFTNVARVNGSSNNLVPPMSYLANSMVNHDCVATLLQEREDGASASPTPSSFLAQLLISQSEQSTRKSFMDLTLYFTFWEGAKFKWAIDSMKLFVVYPHPAIGRALEQILSIEETHATPSNIYEALKKLGVYEDDSSDVFLSANMLGEPKIKQVSVKSAQELVPSELDMASERLAEDLIDNFSHLRDTSRFYKDLTIYGLPSSSGTKFGFSIEKSNVRKYWINIHVQDPATRIPPSSQLFSMLASSGLRSSIQRLAGRDSLEMFSKKFLEQFEFKTQNIVQQPEFVSVADENPLNSQELAFQNTDQLKTCMTISFAYYPYANDPFDKLSEKVKMSFDDISNLEVKRISSFDALENILHGKTESGEGSGGFRLFKRRSLLSPQPTEQKFTLLNDKDGHDIRFIYNVMKTYSKVRNLRGASLSDSSLESMIDSNSEALPELCGFFCREIQSLSEDLTAHYCYRNNIPVFGYRQGTLVSDPELDEVTNLETMFQNKSDKTKEADSVFLSHNNLLLPEFFADTYFQTLLCRDSNGNTPAAAKISGQNFLNKTQVEVLISEPSSEEEEYVDPLIQEGFLLGSVNVFESTSKFLSLMNQYQILAFIHSLAKRRYFERLSYLQQIEQFRYLKRLGYPTDGPLPWEVLDDEIVKSDKESAFKNYFTAAHKKFRKLQEFESNLMNDIGASNIIDFTCVLTKISGKYLDDKVLANAYCQQLGIEIEVLVGRNRTVTVGSFIECDRVIYLDAIGGRLVLGTSEMI